MRLKVSAAVSLLFVSSFALPQSDNNSTANARSVVARSLAAMAGNGIGQLPRDAQATGMLTLHDSGAKPVQVIYKSIGSKMLRVELQEEQGTSVHILKNGHAVYTKAGAQPKSLLLNNTLNQRAWHIPAFLLGDDAKLSAAMRKNNTGQDSSDVGIELSDPTVSDDGHCKHVACPVLHLDPSTGFGTKLEYTNFAENNPNGETKVEIVYSDYREVSGVWVPFKQVTLVDGEIDSELQFDSVQFDLGLSQSEFTLPEVKK